MPAEEAHGPSGTRKLPAEEAPEPPAPRWSGSAAVPPPSPRKRAWGESAEPTPVPPRPVEAPEDRAPVDPWAGADTGGWDLPSGEMPELPPLPPTTPYPSPAPTRPYSGPPAPASPAPGHPLSPPAAYPASPAPAAYPASPAPVPYPASPAPAAYPPAAYPVPVPPPPAPPLPARSKRRRRNAPPPVPPPPGWQAPRGYVPVPVRKRRKWPWVLLFTLACCCGCPAYWAMPMMNQVPASAALPAEVADLRLRQDDRSTAAATKLEAEVRSAHWLASDTFAGVYATGSGKRVTVFGGTGFWFSPESEADAEIARLTEQYSLGEPRIIDTGIRGRHERCAVGRADGTDVVVCTSVDHGSIATAVFTRLSVDDSAALLATLREQIVTQQQS
ncbi:hypothetical protein ACN26Y_13950 [Micromonospora sp. WMMD558]|uniref:hypothetical protein n=1 Tax=unclassified Micromonospora TaxID=2617518 RepID=UPI001E3B0032|nr:hypothetical protein [Micromonospora sp. WMMC415]